MINLLYCGNEKVFDGLMISLLSASKNTKDALNVYCFTMDWTEKDERFKPITQKQIDYLEKMIQEKNIESRITLVDLKKEFIDNLSHSINIKNHFTPYAMLRVLADKIDKFPDKIIYLDTDTIVNNDLGELFNIDITEYEVACVKDLYNWASPSRWSVKKYFNSGVLLLNMKLIKETGYFEKTRKFINEKLSVYPDQDALNKSVTKKLMLDEKFNAKDKYYPEIVVHHFCNVRKNGNFFKRIKPWHVELVKTKMSAYNDILEEYLRRKKEFNEE